jgi:RNA polymerase-interacting CarD/CdnL/TRCF family regulator
MSLQENYYQLLQLDPNVVDQPTIERALEVFRSNCSSKANQGAPKDRRKATHYLEQLNEIRRVMLEDPTERRQHSQREQQRQDQMKHEAVAKFQECVEELKARLGGGVVTEKDVADIIRRQGSVWDEVRVRKELERAGVKLGGSAPDPRPKREVLDSALATTIREGLDFLGLPSLYALLGDGASQKSGTERLLAQAETQYKKLFGQTDAINSAKLALYSQCKTLFSNDTEKNKYDNTLGIQAMEQFREHLELGAKETKVVTRALLDLVISRARKADVEAEVARSWIEDYAEKRKFFIESGTPVEAEQLLKCGFCRTLASKASDSRCRDCGKPLHMLCPKPGCKTQVPTQDARCPKCGYTTGDAPAILAEIERAEQALKADHLDQADRLLAGVLKSWPGYEMAESLQRQVKQRRQQLEQSAKQVVELVAERKLHEAAALVTALPESVVPADLRASIKQKLDKAQTLAAQGIRLQSDTKTEEAVAKFDQALAVCADLPEALSALRACPPPAPRSLRVTPTVGGHRLIWQAAEATGRVLFRVLRKADGMPNNAEDGEVVAESEAMQAEDAGVPPGRPWFYVVYSVRGGVRSKTAAASGPHLIKAEVEQIQAIPSDGSIDLSWKAPAGAVEVQVWRLAGTAPPSRGEGQALVVANGRAHDNKLSNGSAYSYRIAVGFSDPARRGSLVWSEGKTVTETPRQPPRPVLDLVAEATGSEVRLSWTPPKQGRVEIRWSALAPTDREGGRLLALSEAGGLGEPVQPERPGLARFKLNVQGRAWFVPITLDGTAATQGKAAAITLLEEVSGLRSQGGPRLITLLWDWPTGATEVCVCYRHDHFPAQPDERGSTSIRVTRAEYDRVSYYQVRNALTKPHYIRVFVKSNEGDLYSSGVQILETMGQVIEVHYSVVLERKVGLFSRPIVRAYLKLTSKDCESLEDLLVVAKPGHVPVGRNDGSVIETLKHVEFDDKGVAEADLPQSAWGTSQFVKLFFADQQRFGIYRLVPAAKKDLALG